MSLEIYYLPIKFSFETITSMTYPYLSEENMEGVIIG